MRRAALVMPDLRYTPPAPRNPPGWRYRRQGRRRYAEMYAGWRDLGRGISTIFDEAGGASSGAEAAPLVLHAHRTSWGARFGNPRDEPVVGDWDNDGIDEVGLHRESTGLFYWRNTLTTGIADGEIFFGDPGDRFVAGDWGTVDGKNTPAVFRPSTPTMFFRHTLTQGIADSRFTWAAGVRWGRGGR